jgi:hypothetical protein
MTVALQNLLALTRAQRNALRRWARGEPLKGTQMRCLNNAADALFALDTLANFIRILQEPKR